MKNWRIEEPRIRELVSAVSHEREVSALPLVAEWIDAFFELVHAANTEEPQIAYDLIAAWARLWRASPALLSTAGGVAIPDDRRIDEHRWSELFKADRYREDEEVLRKRLPHLADLALSVPDPLGWIQELRCFANEVAETGRPDLASWAIDLIEDLDNAELVHWAARRYLGDGKRIAELGIDLEAARVALFEHAGAFVVAQDFTVAFAEAIDYAPPDESLLESAWKVTVLLEEVVRYRRFVESEVESEASSLAAIELAWGVIYEHIALALKVICGELTRGRQHALAAQAGRAAESLPIAELRWVSPTGQFMAAVALPPQLVELPSTLPVRIHRVLRVQGRPFPGPPATELAGMRVRLAGLEAIIGADATAQYSPEFLSAALNEGAVPLFEVETMQGRSLWLPMGIYNFKTGLSDDGIANNR